MTTIRCKECYELNDRNAIKCEICKARLSDTNISEVDECENDYLFIEEAELKGKVYKLENVSDENVLLEALPTARTTCEIKVEKETITDSNIPENGRILLEADDYSKEVLNVEPKKLTNTTQTSIITASEVPYQCSKCSKRDHGSDDASIWVENFAFENKSKSNSKRSTSPTFSESCDSEYVPPEDGSQYHTRSKQHSSPLKTKRPLEQTSDESDSENNNSRKKSTSKVKNNTSPFQILLDPKHKKPNLKRHMVYKCTACEKITNNYEEHVKHIVIHEAPVDGLTETTSLEKLKKTPSGFLKCDECDKVFMSERDLSFHKRTHQGVKLFQCELCLAFLISQSSLRKHKKRTHKIMPGRKEREYECCICNHKFDSQILMTQHKKSHTEVIKKIEQMTVIEKREGKTVYVCKICAKTSKNKYRHEEHLRVHTKEKPYKCDQCGERISTANALVHHLRLHENDRPFKCDICEATYRHKKSLKKHLRIHTGEKPFECRYCDKKFTFNYTRAGHERSMHLVEPKSQKRKSRSEAKEATETEVPKSATVKAATIETRSSKKLEVV